MEFMSYKDFLQLFTIEVNIDETTFYFDDDVEEEEHCIGFCPEFNKPYWAGYCDIENGSEYNTAEELFNAPIYDGKSIRERWEHLIIVSIYGLPIKDWLVCARK